MIIQPTKEQTRQILRKRAYSGTGFGPHSFECLGIGLSLGLGTSFAGGFDGNFASLFAPGTLLQSVQTDLGLTYGGAPLPTSGNTSTTALTLSGSLTVNGAVPIWAKATNTAAIGAGAQFSIYTDGAGSSPIMTGVTPSAGTPIAITGRAQALAWSAGASVANDTWKATCSNWVDQGPGGKSYARIGDVTTEPLITAGVNGVAGLAFDSINDALLSALTLPAPGTTPTWIGLVFRQLAWGANLRILDSDSTGHSLIQTGSSPNIQGYNGSFGPQQNSPALNTWEASEFWFRNSIADYVRRGSNAATAGTSGGNNASPYRVIGGYIAGNNSAIEVIALAYCNAQPSSAVWRAAVAAKCGVAVRV